MYSVITSIKPETSEDPADQVRPVSAPMIVLGLDSGETFRGVPRYEVGSAGSPMALPCSPSASTATVEALERIQDGEDVRKGDDAVGPATAQAPGDVNVAPRTRRAEGPLEPIQHGEDVEKAHLAVRSAYAAQTCYVAVARRDRLAHTAHAGIKRADVSLSLDAISVGVARRSEAIAADIDGPVSIERLGSLAGLTRRAAIDTLGRTPPGSGAVAWQH